MISKDLEQDLEQDVKMFLGRILETFAKNLLRIYQYPLKILCRNIHLSSWQDLIKILQDLTKILQDLKVFPGKILDSSSQKTYQEFTKNLSRSCISVYIKDRGKLLIIFQTVLLVFLSTIEDMIQKNGKTCHLCLVDYYFV